MSARTRKAIDTAEIKAEIARLIQRGRLGQGDRLVELRIAKDIGLSRAPVRRALRELTEEGLLSPRQTRGFQLSADWNSPSIENLVGQNSSEEEIYLKIAFDRLSGVLPEIVSENALASAYDLAKAETSRILARMAREGWIERRAGYGWRFLPTFPTRDAYLQGYRFRLLVEPAALLEPEFAISGDELDRIADEQRQVIAGLDRGMPVARIFQAGCAFHEALMRASGNAFMLDAVERVNRMRRLIDYRALAPDLVRQQTSEHMRIVELLRFGDRAAASRLLAAHLGAAGPAKLGELDRVSVGSF